MQRASRWWKLASAVDLPHRNKTIESAAMLDWIWLLAEVEVRLDPRSPGTCVDVCTHCEREGPLVRHRIVGRYLHFIPIPSGEALICPECHLASRREGIVSRLVGVAFLLPMFAVFVGAAGVGIYAIRAGRRLQTLRTWVAGTQRLPSG